MSEIEKLTAERNLFKGKYRSIITLLDEARVAIQEVVDHVADEGDRRYFGSTNHADRLHDLVNDMDGWSFDAMLPKGDINKMERDPYEVCRDLRAALAAKDAEIEAANAELARLRRECSDGLDALSDIDDFWEACPYPENRKHLSPAEQISSLDNELNAARDEIEKLKAALKHIAGESGQFGFPWPETHVDYPAFALLTARAALKGDAA
ncbi:hypothetical protein GAO09_19530 [Rhizobiales bacterium RZME27]|uniref:Ead/Ea22-like family protein n=1 Tax=Endobacterium cereale TaxID=2663029 RepID=A0A6A8ABU5_9HYPH|nr:hypothetical protein [Endobacterium cereale]MQY48229.1 hypothetical protein [Endobacterium cereale]